MTLDAGAFGNRISFIDGGLIKESTSAPDREMSSINYLNILTEDGHFVETKAYHNEYEHLALCISQAVNGNSNLPGLVTSNSLLLPLTCQQPRISLELAELCLQHHSFSGQGFIPCPSKLAS